MYPMTDSQMFFIMRTHFFRASVSASGVGVMVKISWNLPWVSFMVTTFRRATGSGIDVSVSWCQCAWSAMVNVYLSL